MTQHVPFRRAAIAAAAAATLTLAGCSSGATSSDGTSADSSTAAASLTITTSGSSAAASSAPTSSAASSSTSSNAHNDADVTFAQLMIVHHQGAIMMADLAATRADNQRVKDLAAMIKNAQAPEIEQMTGWLQAWGAPVDVLSSADSSVTSSGMAGMDHGNMGGVTSSAAATGSSGAGMRMPGMMTDQEMAELTAATGAEFDRMFLEMMITHHQGAVQMAETEISDGANPDANALAASIKTSQTEEIATMQQLLQAL